MLNWLNPYVRRWWIWGLLAALFLLVNVYRLSTAVISDQLMRAFEATGTQLGTLHAAFFYIYALLQLPAGLLADSAGPRKTVTVGAVLFNLGAILFAYSSSYPAAFLARSLIGLGGSVIYVCTLKICANWFRPDEFSSLNGLTIAVAGMGGIVATTPFALAVEAVGWRWTTTLLGGLGLILAMSVFSVVRDTPQEATGRSISGATRDPSPSGRDLGRSVSTVLRDPHAWASGAVLFCMGGVNLTLIGLWGIPFLVQMYDVSVTYASLFTLLGSVGMVIGPPVLGWIVDRYGNLTDLLLGGCVLYTLPLLYAAVVVRPSELLVATTFFLLGFMMGAGILVYTLIKDRYPPEFSGVVMGTVNAAPFAGAAVVPGLMGLILDAYWTGETVAGARVYTSAGYQVIFVMAAGFGLLALVCAAWLYRRVGASDGAGLERVEVPVD